MFAYLPLVLSRTPSLFVYILLPHSIPHLPLFYISVDIIYLLLSLCIYIHTHMCVYVIVYISTSLYVCLSFHVSLYLCFSPCLSVSVYPSHTNVSYPSHCYYSHLFLSQLSSHFRLFGHMLARASLKFEQ